ncbi:MAG: hypothetical protein FWB78_02445 [Treponema sp.]|nr:hypothetical protein [Treponema sp.]
MDNEYIVNGEVQSNKIAMDIKYRILKRHDIERLCRDTRISASFIGSGFNKKRPKQAWDKSYLDLLSYVAVAESFNRDYLLYLDEVADFVTSKPKIGKLVIAIFLVFLVLVAGIAIAIMSSRTEPEKPHPVQIGIPEDIWIPESETLEHDYPEAEDNE